MWIPAHVLTTVGLPMCYVVIVGQASLAVGVVFLCAVPYLAEGIPTFSIFLVFMVLFVWVGISFLSSTF